MRALHALGLILTAASLLTVLAGPALAAGTADAVPSIDTELTVDGWWVVGPFLSGVREAGVDPLYFADDAPDFANPLLRPSFPSVLVPGGEARWRWYLSGADGVLEVDYPEVTEESMQLVTDEWGGSGANTVGYAYAKLHVDGGPRRAMLDLRGAGGISINGVPWPGDPYGAGYGQSPVLLPEGDVELKVAIGASQRFNLKFLPVPSDLVAFTAGATLPDIVRGEDLPTLIGLPVANTTTNWMTVKLIGVKPEEIYTLTSVTSVRIPPLCVHNLALELVPFSGKLPGSYSDTTLPLKLTFDMGAGREYAHLELAIKDATAPRKVTFRSGMDRSVQYYGLLPPAGFDPQREYGLILSLHGAGVEAIGQVSSYRPKDWAYVAAPTNRRPFGFDWQDWGQRDMLEVLAEVKRSCNIDENRVHLTGHSMGGHGTWLNALTFPDLWASAAPSAGWTRFDLYAPMFLRQNVLLGDPKANYIWQLAMRGDDPLALCENALNLPIYALEGGADDNVPPQQPRLMVQRLKQLGYDVTYKEVPGMGHWWDDPATPGIDCVDSDELNAFWESHVRNPWPKEIVYRSGAPVYERGAYWLQAIAERLDADTMLRARVSDGAIRIETANAVQLQLQLRSEWISNTGGKLNIDQDWIALQPADTNTPNGTFLFEKADGRWTAVENWCEGSFGGPFASLPHGFNRILMQPCTVLIPALDEELGLGFMQLARLYAWQWWYRGNGRLTITNEREAMTAADWEGNYVFFGTPFTILSAADDIGGMATGFTSSAQLADLMNFTDDSAFEMILPYIGAGGTGQCLFMGGTSMNGLKRLPAMMGLYSGAGFPDWMVWDDQVKLDGMGGVLGMGFFDLDWQVDPSLSYFNAPLIAQHAAGD